MTSTKAGRFLQFKPGEVTCWAGYNGHKKSMFTSQVALDLCTQGQRVLITSLEMTPAETLVRMSKQCSGAPFPSAKWRDGFKDWTDNKLWLFDHMGRLSPAKVIGMCHYFANELKGAHIFIDSLMMVVGSEEHMDEQKQFMTDLVRVSQETQTHIHLVAHCRKPQSGDESKPPGRYDVRGAAAVSDQAANVVLVWANKAKKAALEVNPHDISKREEPDAMIVVDKQRSDGWEGKLQMWFDERTLRFCDDRMSRIEPYVLEAA
jgi:twinkle protein